MKSLKKINAFLLLFILNITDLAVFGSKMLKLEDNKELENFSRLFYWISLFSSQVFYTLFSKIETAVVAPVTEGSRITNLILKEVYLLDKEKYFTNTLVCIGISTLIYGILSLFLTQFVCLFRKIPRVFYYGVFLWLGLLQFQAAKALLIDNTHFFVIFLISTLIYCLQYKYETQSFAFMFALFCSLAVNFIKLIYKIPKEKFVKNGIFISDIKIFDGFTFLNQHFDYKHIDFKLIWQLKKKILLLSFFCAFNILLNFFTFENYSKLSLCLKKEFLAHSITNFFCSFGMFPSCFVCSYSTILFENNVNEQKDRHVLGLVYFCMIFVINKFFQLVPLHIQALFPVLVGWSIIHEAYNDIKKTKFTVKLFCFFTAGFLFFLTY
ncbi:sulfate permease [Tubulinosema ratisbonensis]|uniref:Sulfate permease n=1 Tax=Tubulinosema ratisbonensis TaxID=291195 RepID=A0A437AP73_9MICR|nr:sulfate permease [Tubulinosema ratisbonensis]